MRGASKVARSNSVHCAREEDIGDVQTFVPSSSLDHLRVVLCQHLVLDLPTTEVPLGGIHITLGVSESVYDLLDHELSTLVRVEHRLRDVHVVRVENLLFRPDAEHIVEVPECIGLTHCEVLAPESGQELLIVQLVKEHIFVELGDLRVTRVKVHADDREPAVDVDEQRHEIMSGIEEPRPMPNLLELFIVRRIERDALVLQGLKGLSNLRESHSRRGSPGVPHLCGKVPVLHRGHRVLSDLL